MSEKINPAFGKIGNALKSTAADHIVAVTEDLYDSELGLYQSEINKSNNTPHYFMSTKDYGKLIDEGKVTVNGTELVYNDNAFYALYEPEE
jgi:hypothetical protein